MRDVPPKGDLTRCGLCGKGGMTEDNHCHGCGFAICTACDVNVDVPWGKHDVMEHADEGGAHGE